MLVQVKHKYYKSRQSYENSLGNLKTHFNQVRKDKTSKFHKIPTTQYNSLIEEMKDQQDMEYICAGLNSFERELVIIDNDDEDFGKKTFSILKSINLIPHFIKTKSNGHSQFFFFIDKFYLGKGWFDIINGKKQYKETYYEENHNKWKRLTKLINIICNGDVGYTGYNCQNPFYVNGDITVLKPYQERYTVDELLNFLESFVNTPEGQNFIQETLENFYKKRQKKTIDNVKKKIITKLHFKDEELKALESLQTLNEIKSKYKQEIIDEIIKLQDDNINKRIFVLVTQICKSFKRRNLLHNEEKFDEIVNTCLYNWNYQDEAEGYSFSELYNRIKYDVNQIIIKDRQNGINWSKVGYTKIQREESLKTRRKHMTLRRKRINNLIKQYSSELKDKSLHFMAVFLANKYSQEYNENISFSSIKNYFKIDYIKSLISTSINKKVKKLIRNNIINQYNNKLIKDNGYSKNYKKYIQSFRLKRLKLRIYI